MRIQKILTKEDANGMAYQFFGRLLPMTRDELKSSFRQACKRLHTDLSGTDGTRERFIQMKAFYDQLVELKVDWVFTDGAQVLRTRLGTPLSELGLGLGPSRNGRDCEFCNHKGYVEDKEDAYVKCTNCVSGWTHTNPCRRCRGTGNYTNKKGQVAGQCFSCKGTGYYKALFIQKCSECSGVGYKVGEKGRVVYTACYRCQGTGEVEVFNPVITKGRLA